MAEREYAFENLACYQHGLKLFQAAYRLADSLPQHVRYNMADQVRRAALSRLLNIAEGYGRYHYLERLRFLYIARRSLCETLSVFIAGHEAGYVDDEQLAWVRSTEAEAERSLNGYINFVRKQEQGGAEYGRKLVQEEGPAYEAEFIAGMVFGDPGQPNP